jgi:formyl-CoA transferase
METHDELDKIISEWTAGRDRYQLMEDLQQVGIPAGPVLDAMDLHVDPHYRDRGFLERVVYPQDRKMGSRTLIGRPWKLSKHDVKIRKPAPKMGEDNHKYLVGLLGMKPNELEELQKEGLISDAPVPASDGTPVPDEELIKLKIASRIDPEYQKRLGIWE